MTATIKHDKKINVWGCFSYHGVGDIIRIKGILKKEQYWQILIHNMKPSGHKNIWSLQVCVST